MTSTCSAEPTTAKPTTTKPTTAKPTTNRSTSAEFRFDDDGSLVDVEPAGRPTGGNRHTDLRSNNDIDLRVSTEDEPIEHVVQLASGDEVSVVGANAYQPEGPMTTFFSTGSSRGTIDSWSVRIASYRTNDIVSIQRTVATTAERSRSRPNLVAV